MSICAMSALSKRHQKGYPKTTEHITKGPVELVYTDLIGAITLVAKGGCLRVSTFTDDYTRMKYT